MRSIGITEAGLLE